jgi:hypothetical protein
MIEEFNYIYENKIWGDDFNKYYNGSSGGGSEVDYNLHEYIPFIQTFIEANDIKIICDLGCGSGKLIYPIFDILNIKYYGHDCYSKVILHNKIKFNEPKYNFIYLDFFSNYNAIIESDLIILKDVLQHWKTSHIIEFLDKITELKKTKYILICNCYVNQKCDRYVDSDGALSAEFFPLKKYIPKILLRYNTKEVSLITVDNNIII